MHANRDTTHRVQTNTQLSDPRELLTFCSSGAVDIISFISTGMSSVTRLTPAAYVPSEAELPTTWP